ncbi:50S ribosomal protein L15 [Roseivirga seohaensis]|uniref:Large ribosomal subunit protein uL15 n=2 Tax=Roseivirga seohaensis TaxID=1914963 RepID=A0A0L8AM58_9BACT|nr:50S ribosomal protein L15 [Roseivirga seohaensis]KOF03548.1 50S ribosomal protein L15 [Roseivirga seohaensis subsp. aquiponti]KYG85078.1 50S ribosomal protein L15 [Roseivirga seohaensis]
MDLNSLRPAEGSTKNRKRIARGTGSGRGGTSTRGHKGAKSRSGYKSKGGFEGGQMPLQRRVPKFGFTNPNRVEYKALNLDSLQELATKLNADTIDFNTLMENGFAQKNDLVKILGRGELTSKVNVSAHKFSSSAQAAIEKVGGTVTKL